MNEYIEEEEEEEDRVYHATCTYRSIARKFSSSIRILPLVTRSFPLLFLDLSVKLTPSLSWRSVVESGGRVWWSGVVVWGRGVELLAHSESERVRASLH